MDNFGSDHLASERLSIERELRQYIDGEKVIYDYRLAAENKLLDERLHNLKRVASDETEIAKQGLLARKRAQDTFDKQTESEQKKALAKAKAAEEKKLKKAKGDQKAEHERRLALLEKEGIAALAQVKAEDKARRTLQKERLAEQTKAQNEALSAAISGENKLGKLRSTFNSITAGASNAAGAGIVAAINAIGGMAKQMDRTIDNIASKKGIIDTALQGSSLNKRFLGSYWDQFSLDVTGIAGVSPLVKQESLVANLQAMVSRGIAWDVEQRAFLETIKDKIAATFDANDSSLRRLIRIQQADTTAARLGMESALTAFLNSMYETSEYMHEVASSIKSSLEEAEALMGEKSAAAFEYQVQKWMGSMYSTGMSQSAVSNIANVIGQLAAGQLSGLTSGGVSNLAIMALSGTNLNLANVLEKGLTDTETNILLNSVVDYLAKLYEENKDNNLIQQQFAGVFGLTAADLRAAANLSKVSSNVAQSSLGYSGMMSRLYDMAGTLYARTSIGEGLENAFGNLKYTMAAGIASNPVLYGIYKIGNLLDDLVGGVDIPLPLVMGTGVNMGLNLADVMRTGALSASILSGLGMMMATGGAGGISGRLMLNALGIGENAGVRKLALGGGSMMVVDSGRSGSDSGYVGNASAGDIKEAVIGSGEDESAQRLAQAKDESDDVTISTVDLHITQIYDLLQGAIDAGSGGFKVSIDQGPVI